MERRLTFYSQTQHTISPNVFFYFFIFFFAETKPWIFINNKLKQPSLTHTQSIMIAPQPNVSKFNETIKAAHPTPKPNDSNSLKTSPPPTPPTPTSSSFFRRFNLENPHQQMLNELSPDLSEVVDQAVRRFLSISCLTLFFVCCIVDAYTLSTSGKLKIPRIVSTLTFAAGFVMSTRFDLGLIHDYIFIMAMAIVLTLDWTTRGHVNGEVLGFGITFVTTITLPFKGLLLRNHVELMMLAFFIIARVGYGHDKVSAPRYRNCVSPSPLLTPSQPPTSSVLRPSTIHCTLHRQVRHL